MGCFLKKNVSTLANQPSVHSGGVALEGSATNEATLSSDTFV